MRLCVMIEGQEGVSWPEWVALGRACDAAGLEGLFRSDHYVSVQDDPRRGSLDAWTTLAGLAAVTERVKLGTMVSPVTFRHPSVLAKAAVTVDHISGGRMELGIGAGWHVPEHVAYGFPFPPASTRLEMLEEQIEIVARSWTESGWSFEGRHYRIEHLDALPKPVQARPNLIVGGAAGRRSAALAARWADEYNTTYPTLDQVRSRRAAVEAAFERAGRDPAELTFSIMTNFVVGTDAGDVRRRGELQVERTGKPLREGRTIVGTVDEMAERLAQLAEAGVDRVMMQHMVHEDLEAVAMLGRVQQLCA